MTKSLPYLVIVSVLAAACIPVGDAGDRGGGGCPTYEVCNPDTPRGLYFRGADFECFLFDCDHGIKTTAVGGTQTIGLRTGGYDKDPFTRSFDATAEPGFSIVDIAPPNVTVKAQTTELSDLRIIDDRGRLYDKIDISAREVERVELDPMRKQIADLDDEPWVAYANGGSVTVRLYGASERLADESMGLTTAGARRSSWNTLTFDGTTAGTHTVTVTQNNETYEFDVPVVDTITELTRARNLGEGPTDPSARVDESTLYCFRTMNGPNYVIGANYKFRITANAELEPAWHGCVFVTGVSPGAAILRVTAGGLSLELDIEVSPAETMAAARQPMPERSVLGPTPGLRARD